MLFQWTPKQQNCLPGRSLRSPPAVAVALQYLAPTAFLGTPLDVLVAEVDVLSQHAAENLV